MKSPRTVLKWIAIGLGIVALGIQFVPVDRSNPASQTQVAGSTQVRSILKRACYDCHSNEVKWPWYSYVAPVSWLVANDVKEGRAALNFSTWNLLSPEKQSEAMNESWEKIQLGEMPLWFYLPLHPSAKLSPADRTVLHAWATSGGAGSSLESGAGIGTGTGTTGADSATTDSGIGTGVGAPGAGTGTDAGAGAAIGSGAGATDAGAGAIGGTAAGVTGGTTGGSTGGTTGETGGGEHGEGGEGDRDGDDD